ncbi:MAG: Nramp family divalent metal transporter, partial [Planctomycetota bacterium]|nr:Nramp family divalent metal transporter [Planctomycetota bacterium]
GSAIGGGEWLLGPKVTGVYGAGLLWLATLSILGQVLYNIEISRYTLYTGEPIFTGKFRLMPGPKFWVVAYLLFDFGSVFPYLAANAAVPLGTLLKGGVVPDPAKVDGDWYLMKGLAYLVFIGALIPLLFGGKIYRSLKAVMTFKLVVVFGFLLFLAFGYSKAQTWKEIATGFVSFGKVPVLRAEDSNGNGVLDEGEDWDGDNRLDVVEKELPANLDTDGDGIPDDWIDRDGDGETTVVDKFEDLDGDNYRDGRNVDSLWSMMFGGANISDIDFTMIGFIAGLAAIAGSGGLSNTPTSNYTRDQGWGMGHHVGAIPSAIGGHDIELSHSGTVFEVTEESLPRWKAWYKHVARDQLAVWLPSCFVGIALPAMLSIQFLSFAEADQGDKWTMSVMTAQGVENAVAESGEGLGKFCWFMTIFCGFLVLAPTMSSSADGIIRRWVDAFWTASAKLREMDPKHIKVVYLRVLIAYSIFGLVMLSLPPADLISYATMFFNIALGISCWHTVAINTKLLPKPLRPRMFIRVALIVAGAYFFLLGTLSVLQQTGWLVKITG